MAELLLAAAAAYFGYKASRRVRAAYSSAKQEMYENQRIPDYYNQPPDYPTRRPHHRYPNRSNGYSRHTEHLYSNGNLYRR